MFLLTGITSLSVTGASVKNTDSTDEVVTVTIHAFYDVNGDGIQNDELIEEDARGFFVWSDDEYNHFKCHFKGKTDQVGRLSFETKITDFFTVWVREKWDYDPSQWKSDTWFDVWDPLPIEDYYEVIDIPLIYVEGKSKNTYAKPTTILSGNDGFNGDSKYSFHGTAIFGLSFTAGWLSVPGDPHFLFATVEGTVSDVKEKGNFGLLFTLDLKDNEDYVIVHSVGRTRTITLENDLPDYAPSELSVTGFFIPGTVEYY
jgi:hypothetical protein